MKVRLLKKVRKRFEIIHMPNGFTLDGRIFKYNLYRLSDSENCYYEVYAQLGRKEDIRQFTDDKQIFNTEKECIDYLKSAIVYKLRMEGYPWKKGKVMKQSEKKVWYT